MTTQTTQRGSYRPHFKRVKKNPPPLLLQERDFVIVRAIHENRFLNLPLLGLLFPPDPKARALKTSDTSTTTEHGNLQRRLRSLFHHGYLFRFRTEHRAELTYAVTNQGLDLLRTRQLPLPLALDMRTKNQKLKGAYVEHTLMVARFRVGLALALRQHPELTLKTFERDNQDLRLQWERPRKNGKGLDRLTINPDAFFILQSNKDKAQEQMGYFLEADRSTMQLSRLVDKYRRYTAMFEDKLHRESYGVHHFRVLTVTKSAERAQNTIMLSVREPTKNPKPKDPFIIPENRRGLFYFTTELSYKDNPQNVLAGVWRKTSNQQEPSAFIASPLPRI